MSFAPRASTAAGGLHASLAAYLSLMRRGPYLLMVLGYAAYTFGLGGLSFWMPTFLQQVRGMPADQATTGFGGIVVVTGILGTLATVPGRVYSRFELINKVRGYEFEGYERTVDSHVKNLRRKIEDDPGNPGIIVTVLGGGYRLGLTRDD